VHRYLYFLRNDAEDEDDEDDEEFFEEHNKFCKIFAVAFRLGIIYAHYALFNKPIV
jgi:hypothetical protein